MTEHSSIGPSALHRLLACPASHGLSQQVPQGGGTSSYASEGSVAHALVENALTADDSLLDDGVPDVGDVTVYEGHEITVDQEMVDGVEQMVAFCRPLIVPGEKYWVEARMDMGALWDGNPPEPMFGTVDFASYHSNSDTLYVVDFKYGRLDVSPHDNPQAMAYALGAVYALGKTPANIVIAIIQPRGMDNIPVKLWAITGLDLWIWADEVLKPGVDACFGPNPQYAAGEHCRFCPAKARCPALYAIAKETAKVDFGDTPPDPMTFDGLELQKVLDAIPILNMWFEAIRAEASHRIEKGTEVPGWKLVAKRATRKWADVAVVEKELIDVENAWSHSLISPTQMEKKEPEIYEELLTRGLVDKTSSGTTLAPDTDNRMEVKGISPADEFPVVDD